MNTTRLLATLAVLAAPAAASAQVIKAWNFDDAVSTPLTALSSTGSSSSAFASDIADVSTNGTGGLSVGYNNTVTTVYSYANIGTFAPDSGSYRLSVTFASWSLTTTDTQTFYVALRSAASTSSSLVADLTVLATASGVDVRFRDAAAPSTIFINDSAAVLAGPLTIDLVLNRFADPLVTDTYDLSFTQGGSTTVVATGTALTGGSLTRNITHLAVGTLGNFTTGSLVVDSLSFEAVPVPEPASFASVAGLGGLALAMLRRRERSASRR